MQGTERVGWDQRAANAREAAAFRYVLYVDGEPRNLTDVRCAGSAGPNGYACDAPLPSLTPGTHVLELAAVLARSGRALESARSAPLLVTLVASKGAAARRSATPARTGNDEAASASNTPRTAVMLPDGTRLVAETLLTGLDRPSALALAGGERLFVGERSGRVLAYADGRLLNSTLLEGVTLTTAGAGGLLALALHPEFTSNRFVYVVDTTFSDDGAATYRLSRFREVGGVLGERAVLLADVPAGSAPSAVARFGPDGKLYLSLGRADNGARSSPASYSGSLLRLDDNGATPRDNPRPSPIYSSGHGMPRGLDWHPATGDLWQLERAGSEGDELNRILPGGDYDDERADGSRRADRMPPAAEWPAKLGASGAAIYGSPLIASLRGGLLIAGRDSEDLLLARFDPTDSRRVATTERLLQGRFGRIGSVEVGPEGVIYFLTANGGQEGASGTEDRLVRLRPAGSREGSERGSALQPRSEKHPRAELETAAAGRGGGLAEVR